VESAPESKAVVAARTRTPRVRALARERVDELFDRIWDHRLTVVVAPAGSGKTTALGQFAARGGAVAWYRADAADGTVANFLAYLAQSLSRALEGLPAGWATVEDAADALERWSGGRAALIVDDLHVLRGTEAEAVLARLVDYLPPHVSVVAASRSVPGFDLSRLRLTGELLEIGADALRFRTWEAEQLFRDVYGILLAPEDLARLTQRVEGWAAGLQLFHLAARSKPPAEQRRLVDGVSSRSRLAREYLTSNVLANLDDGVREFLVDTCVLGVLTGSLCDELTGRDDSVPLLEQLEREQLFTIAMDEDGTYRYHEVLRSHLEALLLDRDGAEAARERYQRAGALLEGKGFTGEALRCFGRAEEWPAVNRLAGATGGGMAEATRWLDALPEPMVATDPWLLLARARARVAAGSMRQGLGDYQTAEELAGPGALAERCRSERMSFSSWLDPLVPPGPGWQGSLRQAVRRDPVRGGAEHRDDPGGLLGLGLAALAAGNLRAARRHLEDVVRHRDTNAVVAAAARLALATGALLGEEPAAAEAIEAAEADAHHAGVGWLARLARAALALTGRSRGAAEALHVRDRCDAEGDKWGAALAALVYGLGTLRSRGEATPALGEAAHRFRALDAGVLESLARSAQALSMAAGGKPAALEAAVAAERLARSVQSPGARAIALAAHARAAGGLQPEASWRLATDLARQCGLRLPGLDGPQTQINPAPSSSPGSARLRCFGPFELAVGGAPVDLSGVRPRARSALRLLALHAGRPVHRELIIEALWPGADPDAGLRNLQVAVSSLRQALRDDSGVSVSRHGDSYCLEFPAGTDCDLATFASAVTAARAAQAAGDHAGALSAATAALGVYSGDLLAEEGPTEWVVGHRDQFRQQAVGMATAAAAAALRMERPAEAIRQCERAIALDRYADEPWRLLIDAHEAGGQPAAAARARQAYEEVMRELGV
jgi:DNA-binding SARP family transcriptional activator